MKQHEATPKIYANFITHKYDDGSDLKYWFQRGLREEIGIFVGVL